MDSKHFQYLVMLILLFLLVISISNCTKEIEKVKVVEHDDDIPASRNYNKFGQIILGCPTDNSIKISLLFDKSNSCIIDYSKDSISFDESTSEVNITAGVPTNITLQNLEQGTRYYYRLRYKEGVNSEILTSSVYSFTTQRISGSTFSFGVQGDSHPERAGVMFNSELYKINMKNVSDKGVDLYFTLGDDFSVERLIQFNNVSQSTVDEVYSSHRNYLGIPGSNSFIFLVNGNHEQAALINLDGGQNNPAVCAGIARKKFYPIPLPDHFYTGDNDEVANIGQLGDYYSFTWGDALFVVIDFYWHTSAVVDHIYGSDVKRNLWDNTLGIVQYNWFKSTLENSAAKYKFVFTHHVLGTGRGGVEMANFYEWGGYSKNGKWDFDEYRPGWDKPIHHLMADNGVTIFFQGHDHLYNKQELDGVIYQSVPNPADNTYTAFNADEYTSGIIFPNSGFLNVTVSPENVQVDYINAYLPVDEAGANKNGKLKYSYSIFN